MISFTAYVNPYLVVSKGGQYTKHIYIGSQRIVSKLGDLDSYGSDPRRIEYAGSNVDGAKVDYANKYKALQQTIKYRYGKFEVPYYGKDNDDYVNGSGFCCDDTPNLKSFSPGQNDNPELFQYYYHSDHLGSSSLITNLDGDIVQHIEYVPFGEVFIEERNNTWNTPYLFNAKELDEETGLYYYGARYYDPRTSIWLSTDPHAEKYYSWSSYAYTFNNPLKYIDPDGKDGYLVIWMTEGGKIGHAGYAMDNYKETVVTDFTGKVHLDENGNPLTMMIPDGTVTYYDLWPGNDGGVGKKNAGKDVVASYGDKVTTLDELMNTDVTGSEGYAPNGVVRIESDAETDMKTKDVIKDFMKTNVYNGRTRNCSDLAEEGVNSTLGTTVKADEFIPFKKSTTPNKLYRETIKQPGTEVLKDPGDNIQKGFIKAYLGL